VRVTQRIDYTVRALVELAGSGDGVAVPAGELADRLGLPRRFVEQQFSAAAKAGIVDCRRGFNGGCALGRSAEEITVGDVVRALQGDILDVPRIAGSAASDMWAAAASDLATSLDRVTLAELARRQSALDRGVAATYSI
jgi:Rrf2 family protein